MTPYLSWGAAVGGVGGFVWGMSTEHRATRKLDIAGDAAFGFAAGLVGGAIVYVVHLARKI